MRWFLILIPIALAALLVFLLQNDETERRDGSRGAEETKSETNPERGPNRNGSIAPSPQSPPPEGHVQLPPNLDPRALEVRIRDERSQPVAGVIVVAGPVEARTGVDGIAAFPETPGRSHGVFVVPGGNFRMLRVGQWDGHVRTAPIEVVLRGPRNVVVRVRVDGEPMIPDGFKITEPRIVGLQVSKEAGEIRGQVVTLRRDVPLVLELETPMLASTEDRKLLDRSGALEATVDVVRGITVDLQPRGRRDVASDLHVETRQDDGNWKLAFGSAEGPICPPEARGRRLRITLMPGHHRLVLHSLALPIDEFDIAEGAKRRILHLPSSRPDWMEVRVHVPDGYARVSEAGFTVRGLDVPPGLTLMSGTRFLHPGDRELEFEATGPGLRPHPKRGVARRSRGGRVSLTAIAGSSALLRCDAARKVKIALYTRGPKPRLAHAASLRRLRGSQFAFPDIPRGTYHVAVYPSDSAPTMLESVAFDGERVDLGTIPTGPGAKLTIQLLNKPKDAPIRVRATWLPIETGIDEAPRLLDGGRMEFEALPPGKVRLDFQMGHRRWSRLVHTSMSGKSSIEVDCSAE